MAELLPCVAPTRAEIRAARVARAEELKRALDADAHPHVFGGAATVVLFVLANDVPELDCAGEPGEVCHG